jgi:Mg2+ and Co2+ transporter CorA
MFEMAVLSTLSDVQRYLDEAPENQTIKEQKKLEQGFIHGISDIHSELDMIQAVLEQQGKVLDAFLEDTEEERKESQLKGWRKVERARTQLKIHRDADRVEKVIESYLNLKRTYATIEDTRNSLMVGFAACAFAFVTVIFTPLSFMTSLFALPVDRFVQQQTKDTTTSSSVYKSSFIGGYTGTCRCMNLLVDVCLLPKPLQVS